eukprot:scaffold510129_cov19-Prasinocladus_malaysianus.AAC.1
MLRHFGASITHAFRKLSHDGRFDKLHYMQVSASSQCAETQRVVVQVKWTSEGCIYARQPWQA